MISKSVCNNFMSEHKSVWHLKEIILNKIKKDMFDFKFYERAQKCVTSQGDYFEEYWKICSILNVVFLKYMQSWNLIVLTCIKTI
jgi:hypothetical protein